MARTERGKQPDAKDCFEQPLSQEFRLALTRESPSAELIEEPRSDVGIPFVAVIFEIRSDFVKSKPMILRPDFTSVEKT